MPTKPATALASDQPPPLPVRRFTVAEYQHMTQVGVLTEDDDVELLRGYIVPKMTRNPPHEVTVDIVHEALRDIVPKGWRIRVQGAIETRDSQPEPDLCVVRGPATAYIEHHPRVDDIALVIEVADTSLARDRGEKAELYAGGGIALYWIVNLNERCVEVYDGPRREADPPRYEHSETFDPGETIELQIGGAVVGTIAVDSLLPAETA